ncbi:AGAP000020-PA-like protein [Anopheles sinensis]|uniref:AGAP000020-PA-like protein n=1 Tax=Anopheles sinensis TaxID=74873 RepID=A0A084WFB9_ANOSI|nr:AGAP000020-PA-like protein [Anopheles sinensis]
MDQPAADVQRTLQDPAQAIGEHFVRHTNDEPVLHQGIAAGCSVSSLAALLITTAGHWVPIICVQGMELLLVIHELADPCLAIRCLELIVPLFTSCPSALTENERFLQLLRLLIENESKVTQAEKPKLKNSVFERPSLRAMIIGQVSQYRRYGFLSPAVLVKLWSECIVRASRDIANDMAGLNLLDELAYSALKHRDAWALMRQTLAPMLKDPENPPRRARFIMDQLVRAFYPATYPMLFLNIELEHIALALLALEIEHERVEVKTGLWPELLCQLDADSSLTVQAALTKVGTALRLHYTPPPHMLVLYKAARAVANAKPTHPLYPLLCQRFFTILLARPEKDVPVYGVADRLLTVDVSLVVEVKKHLHRAEAFYAGLQRDSSKGQSGRALFARLQSTFQMFAQWLADRQLNVMSVEDLDRLPAHYCVPRLKKVFAGKQDFWLDLIDYSVQSSKESHDQGLWARAYRWPDQFPTAGALADYTEAASRTVAAGERREVALQRWLSSYEKPATVPKILFQDTKALHSAMSLPFRQRTELILGSLQKIDQHTQRLYWPTIAEFKRLKREIYEKTKILYTNEPGTAREQAKCSIMCEGAGTVHIPVQVATRNEHMVQRLEDYRRDLASTVEAAIYLPPLIMDEIVQCRMLWKYMLLETARSTEKPMTRHVVAGILQLLQTAFEMLRENSPDHLDFAVKDSFGRCLELFPELAYGEVVALLESSLRRCRKPSTTVMDLLRAKDIPIEQMKSIYELLANSTTESPAKQALFVQVFGGEVEFDMSEWLLHKNATELDVIKFLALTSIPLLAEVVDKRGGTQAAVEREKFYWIVVNHAIQLALHDFPLYFNSVLQTMLNSVSAVKSGAPPMMLVELVNALRMKVNLLPLILPMDDDELRQAHYELAVEINSRKNPFVRVTDTVIKTIASIFDLQRRENHDITDLYAHYQHRVQELTVLYGAFAHIYVLQHATQDRTPGTDAVLTVCRMFRPWLEPYQQPNAMIPIPPWNGEGAELASHMLNAFVSVLRSMLDKLRMDHAHRFLATNMVLPILLGWYNEHFNNDWMPNTVLRPLHAALLTLPWRDVLPMGYLINWLHNALKNNMPELNKFACRVFVSCPWLKEDSRWLDDGPTTRSTFLSLCVQFAHVPTVRDDEQLAQDLALVLANIALLSWGELDPADFEHVMDFYTFSAKPCTVLRSPTSPHHQLDEAVLGLLEVAGGVSSNAKNPLRVDSTDTVKRARYIRTAMRQLTGVALMPQTTSTVMHIRQQVAETMRATTAVANIKVQVAETMRTLVGVVIRPLEAVVPEDSNAHVEVQLREARALLTAMVLGIRSCKSVHQPFSNAFIEVLTSDAHASIRKPLAHGLLGVIKLFAQNTANLMALTEVTLFCCLNASANVGEGATISWAQTLELVSDSIAREWEPEVLAGDGHVLCLQLHFLAHWCDDAGDGASDGGTSVPKFNQLRQLLRHLKAVKKETDEYHIYPLWVCMVYGLLALAPTTPTASMSALVENFSEYLSLLGQQSSPRGWIAGFMHTLIAGKKIPQASQRVIALGLNYCLVNAYRTLQKAEAAKEDAGNAKAAEQSTPEEASDSGAKQPPATDPIDALRALATEPDVESLRDKIEELVESLPSQLELGATVALTKRIIGTFDSRAVRILETLHQALGWDIKA